MQGKNSSSRLHGLFSELDAHTLQHIEKLTVSEASHVWGQVMRALFSKRRPLHPIVRKRSSLNSPHADRKNNYNTQATRVYPMKKRQLENSSVNN